MVPVQGVVDVQVLRQQDKQRVWGGRDDEDVVPVQGVVNVQVLRQQDTQRVGGGQE